MRFGFFFLEKGFVFTAAAVGAQNDEFSKWTFVFFF